MHKVAGQRDPIIKLLRDLCGEEGRRRTGLYFVEGEELVRRAFDFGGKLDSIILSERYAAGEASKDLLSRSASTCVPAYCATDGLLAKTLQAKPTPDCLAIIERKVAALSEAFAGDIPLVQMVERGENADNLGMLLRSADAAGVSSVVLTAGTTDPFNRRVVRGSRGAVFTVPICICNDSGVVIEEARGKGLQVVATSAQAEQVYTDFDYTKPTMVIVGNEHVGISDVAREKADVVVRIPMLGKINSLNIAVAASLMLYEAVRQRGY
ncbi:MAG: RNA methyltransferase [Armatimonadota bacterium]|nr:RNA methyltransferase [Armatimonadota bacterium]